MDEIGISLQLEGSYRSWMSALGIGDIIPTFHILGIVPLSKQNENDVCNMLIKVSFFSASAGTKSIPAAFPAFPLSAAGNPSSQEM